MTSFIRLSSAALMLMALRSFAQDGGTPSCDTVTTGTAIYVGGSTALQPFVKSVGPAVANQAAPYTLFYTGGGSCVGVNNVLDATANPLAAGTQFSYYVTSDDGGVSEKKCLLPTAQAKLDVGISDVFVETCTSAARPDGFGDFVGPAQSMVFVVPNASTQSAITAEEAYIVFGFGGKDQLAPPWQVDDPSKYFFIRNNKSGTQQILAAAIGVPASRWKGFDTGGAGTVYTSLLAQPATSADKSIGIIGLDYLDQNDADGTPRRSKLKMLAFSAKGQKYAFYPDSTHTSYDKKNLREGRYAGLGYAHLIAPVGSNGQPVSEKVKYLVDLLTGGTPTPAPSFDVAKIITQSAHLVPLCAMKVQRTAEGGDLKPYAPTASCNCYFESLVTAGTPAGCTSCAGNPNACGSGTTCRNNWCEAN